MSTDSDGLAEFGYRQELTRTLGTFQTFAAGISYLSILTGTFQLFYFGFTFGGPAYLWSWPLVFVGQLAVALCFAELAAAYPVAGSIYNWAKRLAGHHVGWLAGWMMLIATIVTLAAVALAYQITLPHISPLFQVIGDGTGPYDVAANAVLLGAVLITFTTVVNMIGVRLTARINSTGVLLELVAAVLLVVLLAAHAVRGPEAVFDTQDRGAGEPLGYIGAFLIASLASTYVMYGFDTASSLGEETVDPRRNAPRAVLRALLASFVLGGLILLFAVMAVRDLNAPGVATGGLQYIVLDVLGEGLGTLFLVAVIIAITVCALAIHAAAIRVTFAMARDNNLPAGSLLARVHPKFGTPLVPAAAIGVLAAVILLVNVGQPQIFAVLTSIGIVLVYLAYLLVTVPMLVNRVRGRWPHRNTGGATGGRYFTLGRFGLPINVVAVVWGVGASVNLVWPRREIYNPHPPFHWYLEWGGLLSVAVTALGGFAYYWFVQRHRSGVLVGHAAEPVVWEPAPDARVPVSVGRE